MQAIDLALLEQIQQQLQAKLYPSCYLQTTDTSPQDCIDLATLASIHPNSILELVLNKETFSITIDCKIQQSPEKDRSVQQIQENFCNLHAQTKETVEVGLALGFPLLGIDDGTKNASSIKAPIFLWNLHLFQDKETPEKWTLHRSSQDPIRINPVLEYYLKKYYNITLDSIYEQLIDDYILDFDEVATYSTKLLKALEHSHTLSKETLLTNLKGPLQSVHQKLTKIDSPKGCSIEVAAFIDFFGDHPLQILHTYDQFINSVLENRKPQKTAAENTATSQLSFMKHPFLLSDASLYAQLYLQQLYEGQHLLIENPDPLQGALVVSDIVANVLSNAGTCLIVSDDNNSIKTIQQHLTSLNLNDLCLVLNDSQTCRQTITHFVSERLSHKHTPYVVAPEFISVLKNCLSLYRKLQQYQDKNDQVVQVAATWSMLAEQYLSETATGQQQLKISLDKSCFSFSANEYESIVSIIDAGKGLYEQLGTLQHPLNALHDRFFSLANAGTVKQKIHASLKSIQQVVRAAQQDILSYLFDYEQLLENYFSEVYLDLTNYTDEIVDTIEAGLKRSPFYFSKNSGFYRKMLSKVHRKYEQLEQDKKSVLLNYYDLQQLHQRYDYFQFTFKRFDQPENQDFGVLMEHINDYKLVLYDWYTARTVAIHQLVKDLGPNNVYPAVSFDRQVNQLSRNLDAFQKQFSESKIFKVDFSFASQNIRKRLTQIERLNDNLNKLQQTFDNFNTYHALKFFTSQLNKAQYEVFIALCNSNLQNWTDRFKHSYLDLLLLHYEDDFLPDVGNFDVYNALFSKALKRFQSLLAAHTLNYWQGKQGQEKERYEANNKGLPLQDLYQSKSLSFKRMMEASFDFFQSIFPIIIIDSKGCFEHLPAQIGTFDVVVLAQANQKPLETSYANLARGNYKIVLGDPAQTLTNSKYQHSKHPSSIHYLNQMAMNSKDPKGPANAVYTNNRSTFQYCSQNNLFKRHFLPLMSTTKLPTLLDFSNAAFYERRLKYSYAATSTPPKLQIIQAKNKSEGPLQIVAAAIIKTLVSQSNKNAKARVAVVSFSKQQQQMLTQELIQQQHSSREQDQTLDTLYKKGLEFYSFPDVPKVSVDILVLYTTDIFRNKPRVELENDYETLMPFFINCCCLLAKQKMYVFHSTTANADPDFTDAMEHSKNPSEYLFYAFLAFLKTFQKESDTRQTNSVLHKIYSKQKKTVLQDKEPKASFWLPLVHDFLLKNHPNLSLKANIVVKNTNIPFLIVNDQEQAVLALATDLRSTLCIDNALIRNLHLQNFLVKEGIPLIRVWSKEWWQNKSRASEKLIGQLSEAL